MIENYLGDGSAFGVKVEYARSDRPLGHAGQLKTAQRLLPERFVCLYGDAILQFDLRKLLEFHTSKRAFLTMALMKHETKMKYGVIETDKAGRISVWKEKPSIENEINVGCYVLEKRFLDYIPPGVVYGMKEAIEAAMKGRRGVYGMRVKGAFTDIGDLDAYEDANKTFTERYGKVP